MPNRFYPQAKRTTRWLGAGLALALLVAAPGARAADVVSLFLKLNGVDIPGDSISTGREDSIECLSFSSTAFADIGRGTENYRPITCTKRNDKSSPLLFKGFAESEVVEAEFRFYRAIQGGGGATEHYQTVEIAGGVINSISLASPDVLNPQSGNLPAGEVVSFTFTTLTWTYVPTGATHMITVGR